MSNPLRCARQIDAQAIAKALDTVYPAYRCEAYKPKGARQYVAACDGWFNYFRGYVAAHKVY